jgi:hypothetical protein
MVLSDTAAHTPEAITPGIPFNEWTWVCLQQPVAQCWIGKLLPYQLFHRLQLDLVPVRPKREAASSAFRIPRASQLTYALALCAIECLDCLKGMLDRSISDPIKEDAAGVEITEKCVVVAKRRNRLPGALGGHKSLLTMCLLQLQVRQGSGSVSVRLDFEQGSMSGVVMIDLDTRG